jgi:hypothetical protein
LMNMYTNMCGADVFFVFRRLTTVHSCETRRDPMRLSSERTEKEEGIDIHVDQRWNNSKTKRRIAAIENYVRETLAAEGQTRRWFGYAVLV